MKPRFNWTGVLDAGRLRLAANRGPQALFINGAPASLVWLFREFTYSEI